MPESKSQPPIVILGALRPELSAVIKRLNLQRTKGSFSRYEGAFASIPVVVKIAGVGSTSLLSAMDRMLHDEDLSGFMLVGYSGGLTRDMQAGDLVLPEWVVDTRGRAVALTSRVPKFYERDPMGRLEMQSLLTTDELIGSSNGKLAAGEKYKACAVDMETFAVAKRAAEVGVPLRVVRAVCDPVTFDLPDEALEWVRPDGSQDIGAVARYLFTHPSQASNLFRLANYAQQASTALADGVVEILSQNVNRVG